MSDVKKLPSLGALAPASAFKDLGLLEANGLPPELVRALAERGAARATPATVFREPPPFDYENFNLRIIRIRRGDADRLAVEATGSQGEALVDIPVPDPVRVSESIQGLLRHAAPAGPAGAAPLPVRLKDVGKQIADILLPPAIRMCFSACKASAGEHGLRVRLFIYDPEMAAIPWELSFLEEDGEYLGLRLQTPIVRYVLSNSPARDLKAAPLIRVLGVVSSPSDFEALDTDAEKAQIEQALQPLVAGNLVQLNWLPRADLGSLSEAVLGMHVVHFIGHGTFENGEGKLAFMTDTGAAQLVPAADLAGLFQDTAVRLVFLNACESAHEAGGVAEQLVRRGVSAALGMRRAIGDKVAIGFSGAFYRRVADGWPIDAAVAWGRRHVSLVMGNKEDWCHTILFMRAPNGRLFNTGTGS
jgi:hypothetical protein